MISGRKIETIRKKIWLPTGPLTEFGRHQLPTIFRMNYTVIYTAHAQSCLCRWRQPNICMPFESAAHAIRQPSPRGRNSEPNLNDKKILRVFSFIGYGVWLRCICVVVIISASIGGGRQLYINYTVKHIISIDRKTENVSLIRIDRWKWRTVRSAMERDKCCGRDRDTTVFWLEMGSQTPNSKQEDNLVWTIPRVCVWVSVCRRRAVSMWRVLKKVKEKKRKKGKRAEITTEWIFKMHLTMIVFLSSPSSYILLLIHCLRTRFLATTFSLPTHLPSLRPRLARSFYLTIVCFIWSRFAISSILFPNNLMNSIAVIRSLALLKRSATWLVFGAVSLVWSFMESERFYSQSILCAKVIRWWAADNRRW